MRMSDWSSDVCSSDLPISVNRTRASSLSARDSISFCPAQRGSLPWMGRAAAGVVELFPGFSRMRFLRQWAGLVDVTHDSTPILGKTPVDGLYVNGGWGTGGFKAIPAGGWCLAHLMATDRTSTRLNSSHYCASRMPSSA